jgi:biotin-dependent carboxylase-like uncharacterized protein
VTPAGASPDRCLEVVRAGPLTTVQDLGRPGFAHLGVPRSGALDSVLLALANRLVGNPAGAAALETTVGGVGLRARCSCTVAVTGPPALVTVDDAARSVGLAVDLVAGQVVEVGAPGSGVRSYLAVGGGIAAQPVLGSRSTDVLSGLGPPPLRTGDLVPLGPTTGAAVPLDFTAGERDPVEGDELTLGVTPGPRHDWFVGDALRTLTNTSYTVSTLVNRVAMRLDGPALARVIPDELPSEGLVLGAVQVPADGRPLVFLADHPTTGGYPVVAVVRGADVRRCAQARPGMTVRFTLIG